MGGDYGLVVGSSCSGIYVMDGFVVSSSCDINFFVVVGRDVSVVGLSIGCL